MAHRRTAEHLVRVRFELDPFDWHGHASESLWAVPVPQTEWRDFRIMNSPFFARGISHLDVVRALPVERDAVFDFEDVIERGGHSTYMLIVPIFEARERAYWSMLEKLGCSYESATINLRTESNLLLSVDVPRAANIHDVYEILERGESDAVWMFQEGYAHLNPASAE